MIFVDAVWGALCYGLPTLGKLAMMRSRLTGGPRGGREALILPESSGDPIGGRVRELCQGLGTHRKFTPKFPGALNAGPGLLLLGLTRRLAQRSPLSAHGQEVGVGESRKPGPPSCCGVSNPEWSLCLVVSEAQTSWPRRRRVEEGEWGAGGSLLLVSKG